MAVKANDSSSSVTSRLEQNRPEQNRLKQNRLELDLLAGGRLPPLPTAFLEGRDTDLLAPLAFLSPGELPSGDPPRPDRRELAEVLGQGNAAWGHPRAAELAARLANPETRVVVTGQQPGLYGGPLLTLTKMAATVRWAEALEAAGQPAVPVFWVATEDHDWKEMTQVAMGKGGYDLGDDREELVPVGLRRFDSRLTDLEGRIADELGNAPAVERFRLAGRSYRPDTSFGDAFCRLFVELLGERAPLFLDSMDIGVKRLQQPWLRRLVERRREVDEALTAAGDELVERGYSPQVRHQEGVSPLFLLRADQRRRIVWSGDGYTLRGDDDTAGPVEDLLDIVDTEPQRLSPGVLARPAIQDALLGTTLQIMGPAETSYLTQARAVYRVLEVPAPRTTLRPQVLMLEERQIRYLEELDVSLAELLGSPVDRLIADKLGEDFITPVQEQLEALLDELRSPVTALDKNLAKPWQKTRDQIGRAFDQLSGKVAGAVARRHEVWHRRLAQVRDTCLPEEHLQERHLTVVHYLARYGASFAEAYWQDFELDSRRLQVLRASPPPSGST